MKSKWIGFARTLIVIFSLILFMNALALFLNIKRDMSYNNRAYGLSIMDDNFNNGEYYRIYLDGLRNEISDEDPSVDISQYEAFGRIFDAYTKARMYEDNDEYLKQIEQEKKNISWNKILTVVDALQNDIRNN